MCKPNVYDTLIDTLYRCIVCGSSVNSEACQGRDRSGNEFTYYTPASHYFCETGVFCGPECSLKRHEQL